MKLSKKEKVAMGISAVWETFNIPWNISYQTVISDPYNAAILPTGKIAKPSSLFPWPINNTGSGPYNLNDPRYLEPVESVVHNVFGNPVVRAASLLIPATVLAYGVYKIRKLGKDAERTEMNSNVAEKFSNQYKNDFPGKDLEEQKASAYLHAVSVLEQNRKNIHSEKNAKTFLDNHYQTHGLTNETYGLKDSKFSLISKTLGKIRSNIIKNYL